MVHALSSLTNDKLSLGLSVPRSMLDLVELRCLKFGLERRDESRY